MNNIDAFQMSARLYRFNENRIKELNEAISQICYNNAFSNIDSFFLVKEKEVLSTNNKFVDNCLKEFEKIDEESLELIKQVYINKYQKNAELTTNLKIAEAYNISLRTLQGKLAKISMSFNDLPQIANTTESYEYKNYSKEMKTLLIDVGNLIPAFRRDLEKLVEYKIKAVKLKSPNFGESTYNPTPPPVYYNDRLFRNIDKQSELVRLHNQILDDAMSIIYQLPLPSQSIVMMHYFDNISYVQIAEMMNYKCEKDMINHINGCLRKVATERNIIALKSSMDRYISKKDEKI